MPRNDEKLLVVSVSLPENFEQTIDEVMEDELYVSQKKWNVKLSDEECDRIIKYSKIQLEATASIVAKNEWKFSSPKIFITILTNKSGVKYTEWTRLCEEDPELTLVFIKNEWQTTVEPDSSIVPVLEFRDFLMKWFEKSARCAVFYGVSSYAD